MAVREIELHDVVGNHVAQGAGGVVVTSARFDADGFGDGDLHVINVAAVPDRLEDSVGEAKRQNILDGLFAEVVVDAVDLLFAGDLEELLVQDPGRVDVVAEGLLDDHAAPVMVFFFH